MASKFGGIPVDQPVSKFGGIPVEKVQPQSEDAEQKKIKRGFVSRPAPQQEDVFAGLPQEVIEKIESANPMPTGKRIRGGVRLGVESKRKQAAELERIRMVNPYLAEQIEDTGGVEAFLVGAGRGLTSVGRGASRLVGSDNIRDEGDAEKMALEGLAGQNAAFTAGEVVGETAPFLVGGVPAAGIRGGAARAAAMSGLGSAEGATIAAGKGGDAKEIIKGAAIGGVLGGASELAPIVGRGISRARTGALDKIKAARTKGDIDKAITEAAPTSQELLQASKDIYSDLAERKILISESGTGALGNKISNSAAKIGFKNTPASRKLNPQSASVMDLVDETVGSVIGFDDVENLRRTAQNAAGVASRAGNNQDAAILGAMVDDIDDFASSIDIKDMTRGDVNAGAQVAKARDLWGRSKRQEILDDAIKTGESRAAGAERGIRNELNNVLNNKKKSRYFSAQEREAMQKVVKGTPTANTFRRLGQMGFGRGQQTSVLSGLAGAGVGQAALGSAFGSIGAGIGLVLLPAVGTVSKVLAENLTKRNAKMAGDIVRAGKNSRAIADAYLRNTPKSQRSVDDLRDLFVRGDIDLASPVKDEFIESARTLALDLRKPSNIAAVASVPATVSAEEDQ